MEQARSAISKIMNGEPHSYTRFNLTQNMEGDNGQVEMKESSEMAEEVDGNGVGDPLNHSPIRKSSLAQKFKRTPKNLCFLVTAVLLIFIIGYLIGYLAQGKKDLPAAAIATKKPFEEFRIPDETGAAPLMNWKNVKALLAQKLSTASFESVFREFTSDSHRAGSPGDEALQIKVMNKFTALGMKTWVDKHYVKVQELPASGSNRLIFKGAPPERLEGFLSYSANGTVTGSVVYAHYGQEDDFTLLLERQINVAGKVVLLRAGKISFAEKVSNAGKHDAAGVLIYVDPSDNNIGSKTELFGHVHMGSGDPYTPSFPSFNHTQFPPVQSSGLPSILAQTITADLATKILRQLGGPPAPAVWKCYHTLGNDSDVITLEVNNVLTEKKIFNVFGVIKGFVDADRFMVIGARRDAWGPGFAASTVGTSVLVELARAISEMVKKDEFKPRRSIVFASWSAGEYGSVGATEWLEAYLSTVSSQTFCYINLDGVVSGFKEFKVAGSPLMHTLIQNTIKEVNAPDKAATLYSQYANKNWETNMLEPLKMDNAAYPFIAFAGIPSVAFRFTTNSDEYPFYGTMMDTQDRLSYITGNRVPQLTEIAARFAGHITLRLVHDHLLQLDLAKYSEILRSYVSTITTKVSRIQKMKPQLFPTSLKTQWLISAYGTYGRGCGKLSLDIEKSDLEDIKTCRILNDRLMTVERNFLSPYASTTDSPFRHIVMGSSPFTLEAISKHLDDFRSDKPQADADLFRNQFALATWTIQGCAISIAGDLWAMDEI